MVRRTPSPRCNARLKNPTGKPGKPRRCRRPASPGSTRCKLHGALSTGPRTEAGKARTVAAMKAGRARWLAKLKADGKPVPFGRKPGGKNRPKEVQEQAAADAQGSRAYRRIATADRQQRRARRLTAREPGRAGLTEERVPAARRPPTGDMVALALQAIAKADAHGVHMPRADVIALERDFIAALAADDGGLPTETVEAVYRLLMREEARLDCGERADRRRRARLETACEQWRTTLAGSGVLVQRRPESPLRAPESPRSSPSPTASQPRVPVDDSGEKIAAGIAGLERRLQRCHLAASARQLLDGELARASGPLERLAMLTRWVEQAERATEVARMLAAHRRQARPPVDDPAGAPHSIAPWLRRR